jgi:hypothetical protein
MSFQPVIPLSGYTGWRFLQRTLDAQQSAFVKSVPVQRATEYFRENIAKVRTSDDLVNDRRLLEVALRAFGLEADINSKAFIRRVLDDGTLSKDALATKLSDKRYEAFSREFGFGDLGARTGFPRFAERIIARYEARSFERAVGEQNPDMRLALNLSVGLTDVTSQASSDKAQWFAVMGNPPVRRVFETALGLPPSIGTIDIDLQLKSFQERSRATFGTEKVSDFRDPATQEKLIRLFLVRSEVQTSQSNSARSVALQLLRGIN